MNKDKSALSYSKMKWAIFSVLLLIAPALLFLVQAFMFIPAIFFAAGIVYMIPKAILPSHSSETLTFIGIFGIHFFVYTGVYILLSIMIARLLFLIRSPKLRNLVFGVVCLSVVSLALFPIYASGGHGSVTWATLFDVFRELNQGYGPYTVVIIYGFCLVCLATLLVYRHLRRNRIRGNKSLKMD